MARSEVLKSVFTKDLPLGPISSTDPTQAQLGRIFKAYFDTHNFPYGQLQLNPTMIVGRKGAGKTAALLSHMLYNTPKGGEYSPIIFFQDRDAAVSINLVVKQVSDAIQASYPGPMVEQVADFWKGLFQISIVTAIASGYSDDTPELELMRLYVRQYDIVDADTSEPFRVILKVIQVLRQLYDKSDSKKIGLGFFESLSEIDPGPVGLKEACFAATAWLRRNSRQSLILFDSVESLSLDDPNHHLAISGLLKAIGSFNSAESYMSFRCCIPSEIYFYLTDLSSNTIKDFNRVMILQWSASELLRIAAKRCMKFLELWYPDDYRRFSDAFDVGERSGAIGFWKAILPDMVKNRADQRNEGTLTYLLRHTQLLPRQIIRILNSVISTSIAQAVENGRARHFPEITTDTVVQEVAKAEGSICSGILDSYQLVWPQAEEVLQEVIPRIGSNTISYGDLQSIFAKSRAKEFLEGYRDMFRLLSELGAIGRLTRSTDRFHVGVFEYSEPNRLIYSTRDVLCVHPIFSNLYNAVDANNPPKDFKPIYPYGVDPDGEDLRLSRSTLR